MEVDYHLRFQGDPILHKMSLSVVKEEFNSPRLLDLISNMFRVMVEEKGVGISAVQIGCLKRVIIAGDGERTPIVMCNPRIIYSADEKEFEEGCLSFPGTFISSTRPSRTSVEYFDIRGIKRIVNLSGLMSLCFLHELDHTYGKTLEDLPNFPKPIDRTPPGE